jgi:hypothetical protein
LRVIAVAVGRKGAEIWAKETNLQPVHCKPDRLLGNVRMICNRIYSKPTCPSIGLLENRDK